MSNSSDLDKASNPGPLTEPSQNLISWDGPDDPKNPINWSTKKKWLHIAIVGIITFVSPLASSMFAPGIPQVMEEFGSSNTLLAAFVVSVYVLGYAAGPLILSPLSELYGRLYIYWITNIMFVLFNVGCALAPTLSGLIVLRFFAGCAGSAPLTIGGGTIADLTRQDQRGVAMAIYAMGPLLGPVVGPVGGGFLTEAKGWRWVFWVLAMISGFNTTITFIFMEETYPFTLLQRKTARLRKETSNEELRSSLESSEAPRALFKRSLLRPMKLFLNPIVFFLSLYMATVYGYVYLIFTTFTTVFQGTYGFTSGTSGLAFLGIGIGSMAGAVLTGKISDGLLQRLSKGGELKPEYRLPPMIPGSFCVPIGLFWYGWSVDAGTHWIVPIIGSAFVGMGMITVFLPTQMYLLDAFTIYAASALAANTILRSIFGAVLPLAGEPMYKALGYGWGNSLLAFIALAMCVTPIVLFRYGERMRRNSTMVI